MKIEICGECASKLVAQDLKEVYKSIDKTSINMYSFDKEENDKEVKKFKAALKTVIEFYGGKL
jgi:outer membrane lipoprotein-sorting protein